MWGILLIRGGVSSDYQAVMAKIQPSLQKNATRPTTTIPYDWSLLNNRDIWVKYALTLRNKFVARQETTETNTLNDEYENFVNAHLEAAEECIPTKQRTKSRVPWETLAVRKKHADVNTASKCNRKNPTNTNALKLKKCKMNLLNMLTKRPDNSTTYCSNTVMPYIIKTL